MARFSAETAAALLQDPGIVRNRLKVASTITNAQAFLAVQEAFGSFDAYVWRFAPAGRVQPWPALAQVPAVTPEAEALSKDLKRRGFRFVGPTIMYAFLQAAGLVDDHVATCWKASLTKR